MSEKQENKIKLIQEAIHQILEDMGRVQTDWGKSVLMAELSMLNEELKIYQGVKWREVRRDF